MNGAVALQLCLFLLGSGVQGAAPPAQTATDDPSFSFVVLGHIRGDARADLNYLLGELLDEVRALEPDLVVLTGDMIWGDVRNNPADSAAVVSEWERLDSALTTLDAPVYRVPGNHDINDLVTRDIYFERYGPLPRAFSYGGYRFILLSSAWIPEDGDRGKGRFVRGAPLDSAQKAFLAEELSRSGDYRGAFVFTHHLLWWEDDAPWWTEVHPLLAGGEVRAVFSGEYGPMKFSHLERDGIEYFQSGIEPDVRVGMLRAREASRLLSQQFDNYLYVTVTGDSLDIEVRTVGETSSGHYTPQRWRSVHKYEQEESLFARAWAAVGTPRRLTGLALLTVLGWVGGLITARLWSRRRPASG